MIITIIKEIDKNITEITIDTIKMTLTIIGCNIKIILIIKDQNIIIIITNVKDKDKNKEIIQEKEIIIRIIMIISTIIVVMIEILQPITIKILIMI